jgi:pimeloyl-ACP methyl ester carboxylesterase
MPSPAIYKGGSGEPTVLLHGFTNDWRAWQPVIPALEQRRSIFVPTLAGHFEGPLFEEAPVSLAAMADVVERQMDEEGIERAHLVGNSLGGWLSLELATRGRAESVVAINPAGGWEVGGREHRDIERLFLRNERSLRIFRPLLRFVASRPRLRAFVLRDMVADTSKLSATMALGTLEAAAACTIYHEMLALSRAGELFDELGEIECPLTIARCTRDRLFPRPAHYVKFKQKLADARWVELEGLGHVPMSDDPERIVSLILEGS